MRKIGKIVASTLVHLVVFDLIGVAVCLFFDIAGVLPLRIGATSTALYYTVWIVLGVFCGMLSYNNGGKSGSGSGPGDWSSRAGAAKIGLVVAGITTMLLTALSVACYLLLWRHGVAADFFVPDTAPLTLVFFTAVLASTIFAHVSLRPEPR